MGWKLLGLAISGVLEVEAIEVGGRETGEETGVGERPLEGSDMAAAEKRGSNIGFKRELGGVAIGEGRLTRGIKPLGDEKDRTGVR